MMGFTQELSAAALIDTKNNPNLSVAIDWIQSYENRSTNVKSTQTHSPQSQPTNKPELPQPQVTEVVPLSEKVAKTAALVNFPAPAILVESRITKKMEEGKRQWAQEQNKKDYERLQKEKKAKKEEEARIKAQLELDRKERAEKQGQALPQKDKEQQELEFRQKEAEKEKVKQQQRRALERAEKERVLRLVQEDKMKRTGNPTSINTTTPTTITVPQPSTTVTIPRSGDTCMLQIRLPHGNPLRQKFSSTDPLQIVHDFVASHLEPGLPFTFIIPMPRYEYTEEDMFKSLAELKLNGATLTVFPTAKRGIIKKAEVLQIPPPHHLHNIPVPMDEIPNVAPPVVPPQETVADKINKLPTYQFTPSPDQTEASTCLICQCEFTEGEEIKKLPCNHEYHKSCVDPWLIDNDSCPLCTQKAYE